MQMLRKFEPVALLLMILGALNWAIVALFDTNVVEEIFGTGTVTDIVYVVIGAAALVFVPRLLDEMHIGHGPHPRGV
ncbi:MAG TPA: DUF378 domain-containing protein [Solirubrobacterales bacterium]|nr:DUF378 domain-containing protein [Solirubrobacterales bacterium]